MISKPFTHVINCSLRNGSVPDAFTGAKVTPIFKSSAHDDFDNYRPISLPLIISKILERYVHIQITEYLESHELLSTYQIRFRKNRSTELATVCFIDQIRRAMDNGMITGAIHIDLSKAFDTISHTTLIGKLPNFEITGMTFKEH